MTDPISFDPFLGWVDTTDPDNLPEDVRIIGANDLLRYENFGVAATGRINSLITETAALAEGQAEVAAGTNVLNNVGGDWSQVPNLRRAIEDYNPGNPDPIKVLGLGGTIATGQGVTDAQDEAPVQLFAQRLRDVFGVQVVVHNAAFVDGNIGDANWEDGQYEVGKTAAGWTPDVVFIAFGMREGTAYGYHAELSPLGVMSQFRYLVDAIAADGADPIVATTPHPHTGRATWDVAMEDVWYPTDGGTGLNQTGNPVLVPNTTVEQSVKTGDPIGAGVAVPYSVRHRIINRVLVMEASKRGIPVLDVERFWLLAVAQHGEDALFAAAPASLVPNTLGTVNSFGSAAKAYLHGLANSVARGGKPDEEAFVRGPNGTSRTSTTTLAIDPDLQASIKPYQIVEFEFVVFFTTPAAANIKFAVGGTGVQSAHFGIQGGAISGAPSGSAIQITGTGNLQQSIVKGLVTGTEQGGTFGLLWAQGTSNAGATFVTQWSYLKHRVVSG